MHADDEPVGHFHFLLRVESNCIREPKNPHATGAFYPLKLLNVVASEKLKLDSMILPIAGA
jgi:hypothetical protein